MAFVRTVQLLPESLKQLTRRKGVKYQQNFILSNKVVKIFSPVFPQHRTPNTMNRQQHREETTTQRRDNNKKKGQQHKEETTTERRDNNTKKRQQQKEETTT
jgi:hypothetical protein